MRVYSEALGSTVELPEEPVRIVSLAPSITETLFMLGVGDRVVGVSHYCRRPEEAADRVRVGSYVKVDYERLDELEPDLILTTTGVQLAISRELHRRGYPVFPIPLPTTVYGILDMVVNVGRLVGKDEEGYRLAAELSRGLAGLRAERSVKGYYEVDLGGPVTVGRFSYITSSLRVLGVLNVFSDVPKTYFTPNYRVLSGVRDLEVIVYEPAPGGRHTVESVARLFERRGLGGLHAVRERRILVLEPDTLAHYGPSHVDSLNAVHKRLWRLLEGEAPGL